MFNSVQTRCIVKGEAQKSPLFWRFSGGFWFSQDRLFSRNSTRKPLNLIKSPIFTNAPCKTTCLYNAPSMHTVEMLSHSNLRGWPIVGIPIAWYNARIPGFTPKIDKGRSSFLVSPFFAFLLFSCFVSLHFLKENAQIIRFEWYLLSILLLWVSCLVLSLKSLFLIFVFLS